MKKTRPLCNDDRRGVRPFRADGTSRSEDRDPLTLARFEEVLDEVFRRIRTERRRHCVPVGVDSWYCWDQDAPSDDSLPPPRPEDGEGGMSRPVDGSDSSQGN